CGDLLHTYRFVTRFGGSSSAAQRSRIPPASFNFQYRFGPLPCTSRRFSLERRQRTRKASVGDTLARAAIVFIRIGSCRKKVSMLSTTRPERARSFAWTALRSEEH